MVFPPKILFKISFTCINKFFYSILILPHLFQLTSAQMKKNYIFFLKYNSLFKIGVYFLLQSIFLEK